MLKGRFDRRGRGFTLIELMVTIALMALLTALAFPSMATWIYNSKVRAVSDVLQNGLRLAQTESLRRSRQVVFSLTDSATPVNGLAAKANGTNWSINLVHPTDPAFIESGTLSATGSGVTITGPAAICFNSIGRLVPIADSGIDGGQCRADAIPASYTITVAGADRPLRVRVEIGGQVRMCDPAKTLSSTNPDGCP